jgi:hypothetical protein
MEQRSTQPDSTQHRYQIGDLVKIVADFPSSMLGVTGKVVSERHGVYVVRTGRHFDMAYDASELEPVGTLEDLIARAVELGAVEFSSWVDAGLLCRRFITSDGSIDLTVRVK